MFQTVLAHSNHIIVSDKLEPTLHRLDHLFLDHPSEIMPAIILGLSVIGLGLLFFDRYKLKKNSQKS